jgi:hypothetical protein
MRYLNGSDEDDQVMKQQGPEEFSDLHYFIPLECKEDTKGIKFSKLQVPDEKYTSSSLPTSPEQTQGPCPVL